MNETRFPSPDGRYTVYLSANEFRMSHWVEEPIVEETATGVLIFRPGSTWHADSIQWSADSRMLRLSLREYPGTRPNVELEIYPEEGRGRVIEKKFEGSFRELVEFMYG